MSQRLYRMTPPHTATVEWPGRAAHPLKHIVYHSADGFAWGYGGSGPADLALSLLADHLRELRRPPREMCGSVGSWVRRVENTRAWQMHQAFKSEVVAIQDRYGEWALTTADIDYWLLKEWPTHVARGELSV